MNNLTPLLLLILIAVSAPLPGQDTEIFPEQRRRELREEVRYVAPEREKPVENPFEPIDWAPYRTPILTGLGIVFAAGLGLLLYRLYRDLRPGTSARTAYTVVPVGAGEIVEEHIVTAGVAPDLLERAEGAGQYDVAIRLLYLGLLKELQDAGLIRWRRDFSNRDYRRQLIGNTIAAGFHEATIFYERYWYGKYPVDRLSYRVVQASIRKLRIEIADVTAKSPNP